MPAVRKAKQGTQLIINSHKDKAIQKANKHHTKSSGFLVPPFYQPEAEQLWTTDRGRIKNIQLDSEEQGGRSRNNCDEMEKRKVSKGKKGEGYKDYGKGKGWKRSGSSGDY